MAKLKDLAGLAALGFLGYKLSQNKDQSGGMTGAQNEDLANANRISKLSDESDALARANRGISSGQSATDSTNAGVLKAIGAPKTAPNDAAGNQGVLSPKTATSTPKPKRIGMTGAQNDTLARVNRSTGMSGAQNDALAKANRGMGKATPATDTPSVATKPSATPSTMPNTYRDLSGKVKTVGPSGPSAAQIASDAVTSGAKKIGSGVANYVENFETPAEARSRRAKEASGMKRGGAVKKMASGGMTASRRADGIATKGKTRGRIC